MEFNGVEWAWNNNNGDNGRDNDPWGKNNNRGGRDQGPPDLDEVFSKLSQKLGGKFGKKGGNGNGPSIGGGGDWLWCHCCHCDCYLVLRWRYTVGEAEKSSSIDWVVWSYRKSSVLTGTHASSMKSKMSNCKRSPIRSLTCCWHHANERWNVVTVEMGV